MIITKIRNRGNQIPQARPNDVDLRETRSGSRVGFRRIAKPAETLGEFRYVKSMPFWSCPETTSVIHRRMDFQSVRKKMDWKSVRKKTDWKSILRFAKPHIISGQIRRPSEVRVGCFW